MKRLNTTSEILDLAEARRRLSSVQPLVGRMREVTLLLERETEEPARDRLHAELLRLVREVNLLGAIVKDPLEGLLDFHAWRRDEIVHLCWRNGEADIAYWHGLDEGFAGRQPLDEHVV